MTENKDYSVVVDKTIEVLSKNREWEDIYRHYADEIINKEAAYNNAGKKFYVPFPLVCYSRMGLVMGCKKIKKYDLRFCGQSVGTIKVNDTKKSANKKDEGPATLSVTKKLAEAANRSFGYNKAIHGTWNWHSKEAIQWREHYRTLAKKGMMSKITKHREHLIESSLLKEFSKKSSKNKSLCNIQPVTFGGNFFQLTTPLRASKHDEDPKIALTANRNGASGGGIDILARIKHSNGQTSVVS